MAAISCGLFAGSGCRNVSPSGNEILSKDTMRVLLGEMFQADAYNDGRVAKDTNFKHDTALATLYTDIFRSHGVTWARFMDSYEYYMGEPEVLRAMIDTLAGRTNREMTHGPQQPYRPPPFRNLTPQVGRPGPNGHPAPVGPNGRLLPPIPGPRPLGPKGSVLPPKHRPLKSTVPAPLKPGAAPLKVE
jgi:hypothetical protein